MNESLLYALVTHQSRASTAVSGGSEQGGANQNNERHFHILPSKATIRLFRSHCGDALILLASFTGGSILIFGP